MEIADAPRESFRACASTRAACCSLQIHFPKHMVVIVEFPVQVLVGALVVSRMLQLTDPLSKAHGRDCLA
jgi:hypothetical protein